MFSCHLFFFFFNYKASRLVLSSFISGTLQLCVRHTELVAAPLSAFLNIFCFCQVHTISVLYGAHLYMKCSLSISNFLEKISSLSHSIVFLYFFALITEEGSLTSPCYSLALCIQMGISFPFSFDFSFSSFLRYL